MCSEPMRWLVRRHLATRVRPLFAYWLYRFLHFICRCSQSGPPPFHTTTWDTSYSSQVAGVALDYASDVRLLSPIHLGSLSPGCFLHRMRALLSRGVCATCGGRLWTDIADAPHCDPCSCVSLFYWPSNSQCSCRINGRAPAFSVVSENPVVSKDPFIQEGVRASEWARVPALLVPEPKVVFYLRHFYLGTPSARIQMRMYVPSRLPERGYASR